MLANSTGTCTLAVYNDSVVPPQFCSAGYVCIDGGSAQNTTHALYGTCTPCRFGEYCPYNTSNLNFTLNANLCRGGYYCSLPNQTSICPAGTFCPSPSVAPVNCTLPGTFCPEGQASMALCPAGYYCPSSEFQILCPIGYFCKGNLEFPLFDR
jgi:hypothetical protein